MQTDYLRLKNQYNSLKRIANLNFVINVVKLIGQLSVMRNLASSLVTHDAGFQSEIEFILQELIELYLAVYNIDEAVKLSKEYADKFNPRQLVETCVCLIEMDENDQALELLGQFLNRQPVDKQADGLQMLVKQYLLPSPLLPQNKRSCFVRFANYLNSKQRYVWVDALYAIYQEQDSLIMLNRAAELAKRQDSDKAAEILTAFIKKKPSKAALQYNIMYINAGLHAYIDSKKYKAAVVCCDFLKEKGLELTNQILFVYGVALACTGEACAGLWYLNKALKTALPMGKKVIQVWLYHIKQMMPSNARYSLLGKRKRATEGLRLDQQLNPGGMA